MAHALVKTPYDLHFDSIAAIFFLTTSNIHEETNPDMETAWPAICLDLYAINYLVYVVIGTDIIVLILS